MREERESWFSGDERGLVPHILFLFHSVPLLSPKPEDREQTGLVEEERGSLRTGKGRRPNLGPSWLPMPTLGLISLHPPTKGHERGLLPALRSMEGMCAHIQT